MRNLCSLCCILLVIVCRDRKGKKLYTCSIRPGAIYGPGEERHLPRILKMARLGLLKFRIGGANVLTDWVYADNLVHAHLLASMALIDDLPGRPGLPPAAGQAYFISDGMFLIPFLVIFFLYESNMLMATGSMDILSMITEGVSSWYEF